jgi:hypothetical protein
MNGTENSPDQRELRTRFTPTLLPAIGLLAPFRLAGRFASRCFAAPFATLSAAPIFVLLALFEQVFELRRYG